MICAQCGPTHLDVNPNGFKDEQILPSTASHVLSCDRSLLLMGALTVMGSAAGAYIMGMAVLSPCPLLVSDASGGVIIVSIIKSLHYLLFYR